jgi:hypothetical protein
MERIRFCPQAGERYLVIHAHNARPHSAQKCRTFYVKNGLRPATHAPDSLDPVPSDFFFSGYVNHRLHEIVFPSGEELLAGIYGVQGAILIEALAHIFGHWIERLEWVSQTNGGYYP